MDKKEQSQKSRLLRLYKNCQQVNQSIQIDLSKWKLLASCGTHWIFCIKEEGVGSFCKEEGNLFETGRHVMRMKKSKQFEKLVKQRCELIAEGICEQSSNQKTQSPDKDLKQKKEKTNNTHPKEEFFGIDKDEQLLNGLIEEVYAQFLEKCLDGSNEILPRIKNAIVKGSNKFYVTVPGQDHNIKELIQFVLHISQELTYYHLINSQLKVQLTERFIQNYPQSYPFIIDEALLIQCGFLNMAVSFEENQLVFHGQKGSEIEENQLFEVFEFKPKPILPNIYTQKFIEHYLAHYHQVESTQVDNHQEKQPDRRIDLKSDNLSSIKSLIELSLSDHPSHNQHHRQLKIESTRWFKKNCLSAKKNRQNPLCFFRPCVTVKYKQLEKDQRIDFFHRKHLKKRLGSHKHIHQQNRSQKVYDSLIGHINDRGHKISSEKNLSLLDEILSLQFIDLSHLVSVGQRNPTSSFGSLNIQESKDFYFDILQIHSLTLSLLRRLKHKKFEDDFCILEQQLCPSYVLHTIGTLFRSEIYEKAHHLSSVLKKLVFDSPTIKKSIIKLFNLDISQGQTFTKEMTEIRQRVYYIVRLLIGLTWKDVSFMVQTLTLFDVNQTDNTIENHSISVIKCAIIDYGIKTVSNVYKNFEKEKEFLFNYQTYVRGKNGCEE